MEIKEVIFRGKKGVQLKTKQLTAVVLPENGGKVGSLKVNKTGLELYKQVPGDPEYKELTYDGDYCSADVYAFDDMFPTIDPWNNGKRTYADHGEVVRMPWKCEVNDKKDTLSMKVRSKFGEYEFSKVFSETDDGRLAINYTAENLTDENFPCLWAAHMMLEVQKDAVISFNDMEDSTAEIVFSTNDFLGKRGTKYKIHKGSDLLVNGRPDNVAYKYYVLEERKTLSYGCFDLEMEGCPYIGVWMNNGDFKNMKNVAIEVCTGGFDTPGDAKAHGHRTDIGPESRRQWSIVLGTSED